MATTKTQVKKGADFSVWNANVDYAKVAQQVDFLMLRTGYGRWSTQKDKRFDEHLKGCKDNNIPYGIYHYSYADSVEKAIDEAKFVIKILQDTDAHPTYPVAIDFEDATQKRLSARESIEICEAFCREIEKAGYKPMIYSFLSWMTTKLTDVHYDVWVAQWSKKCTYNKPYTMWQYTDSGTLDGVKGPVDLSYCYKEYEDKNEKPSRGHNPWETHVKY